MKAKRKNYPKQKGGYVLLMVMGLMAALSAFGIMASKNAILEKKISVVQEDSLGALYQAQAGVKIVEKTIERLLSSGTSLDDAVHSLSVAAIGGLTFDTVTNIRVLVPGKMVEFDVTGRQSNAARTLRARYILPEVFDIGVFGDTNLDSSMNFYSYRSSVIAFPTSIASTGEASAGSNGAIRIDNANAGKGIIDGAVSLGASPAGVDATISYKKSVSTPQSTVGRVDPDPLAIRISGNEFYQGVNGTLSGLDKTYPTLAGDTTLGAGDYFVTKINMKNNDVLTVTGKVRIFMPYGATVSMKGDIIASKPENCQIIVDSDNALGFYPKNDMSFFLYSPYAHVDIQPGNDVFGAVWARRIDAQPPGSNKNGGLFVDLD